MFSCLERLWQLEEQREASGLGCSWLQQTAVAVEDVTSSPGRFSATLRWPGISLWDIQHFTWRSASSIAGMLWSRVGG